MTIEITMLPAPRLSEQFADFEHRLLSGIASSLGVSYAELSADFVAVERHPVFVAYRQVRAEQDRIIRQTFHGPLYNAVMLDMLGVQQGLRP